MNMFYRCKSCKLVFCLKHATRHDNIDPTTVMTKFLFLGYSGYKCLVCEREKQ